MFTKRLFMFVFGQKIVGVWAVAAFCCVCFSAVAALDGIPLPSAKARSDFALVPKPAAKGIVPDFLVFDRIPAPPSRVMSSAEMKLKKVCAVSAMKCGLARWQNETYEMAAAEFVKASDFDARKGEPARAAGAYWAARSYAKMRKKDKARVMLERARHLDPEGFYGALAAHGLKDEAPYDVAALPSLNLGEAYVYGIDPALVHAIVMQESRFNPAARSSVGARGLMQIMPATATYIAKQSGLRPVSLSALSTPEVNLDLGQRYIDYLLKHGAVDGDLMSLLIAYNGGPGNLRRWRRGLAGVDDPLLFIESLPSAQTRDYVRRVMGNYWAYRSKQGRKLPTLAALARGKALSYKEAIADLPYRLAHN